MRLIWIFNLRMSSSWYISTSGRLEIKCNLSTVFSCPIRRFNSMFSTLCSFSFWMKNDWYYMSFACICIWPLTKRFWINKFIIKGWKLNFFYSWSGLIYSLCWMSEPFWLFYWWFISSGTVKCIIHIVKLHVLQFHRLRH